MIEIIVFLLVTVVPVMLLNAAAESIEKSLWFGQNPGASEDDYRTEHGRKSRQRTLNPRKGELS